MRNSSIRRTKQSDRETAEIAWLRVEKKIRTIITQTMTVALKVMEEIQEVILKAVAMNMLGADYGSSSLESVPKSSIVLDTHNNLVFSLQESSFHRLLLHGTCQFYGLHSKSMVKKSVKHKFTVVTLPKEKHLLSDTLSEGISFVSYLSAMPGAAVDNMDTATSQITSISNQQDCGSPREGTNSTASPQ